jgi:hypothetical protein
LEQAFASLKSTAFPRHPADMDLADWILELAEIDGHYAGMATTVLATGRADPIRSEELEALQIWLDQLRVADEEDTEILKDCHTYLARLFRVANALQGRRISGQRRIPN